MQLDLNLNTASTIGISLFPGNFMVITHCKNDLLKILCKSEIILYLQVIVFKYITVFTQTLFLPLQYFEADNG